MPKRTELRSTFTKGVLDPALADRIDLEHYYEGLSDAVNLVSHPQGGFSRRPGTSIEHAQSAKDRGYSARLRRRLAPIVIDADMVTAPNGGTVAHLLDPTATFQTNVVGDAAFALVEVDFGAPQSVVAIDVDRFRAATAAAANAVVVEYLSGSNWVEVEGSIVPGARRRKGLTTTSRTRRFAGSPGAPPIVAQRWRVMCYGAIGVGALYLRGLRFWSERRAVSPCQLISFARTSSVTYDLVVTERNVDVFLEGSFLGAMATEVDHAMLEDLQHSVDIDNVQLYHPDLRTGWLVRDGSDDEWGGSYLSYVNVPVLTERLSFAGAQNEVQDIRFPQAAVGDRWLFWVGGQHTSVVTYADGPTFAGALTDALVAAGVDSGVQCELLSVFPLVIRVHFTGGAGSRRWPVLSAISVDDNRQQPTTIVRQRGIAIGEDQFGETNGYPACGVLHHLRHMVAGFRAAPSAYGFSIYGSAIDFEEPGDPLLSSASVFGDLGADKIEQIRKVHIGQHITVYTNTGEWFLPNRVIDATEETLVTLAHRHGITSSCPVVYLDGRSMFMQRGGRTLRDMAYSDIDQNYTAPALSLLAPHLLTDVVTYGVRSSRTSDEGHWIFLINRDGTAVHMTLMRDQSLLIAMCPWTTDGKWRSASGDVLGRLNVICERQSISGGADLYLESIDEGHTLDAAVIYDLGGAATTVVDHLEHLDDKSVWCWLDGDLFGPLLVESSALDLPKAASVAIVGMAPEVYIRPTTLRDKLQNGDPWRPPARIYLVELGLAGTGQLDLAANGSPFRPVKIDAELQRRDIGSQTRRPTLVTHGGTPPPQLERLTRAICMIPAAGEFAYSTELIEIRDSDFPNEPPLYYDYERWPNRHTDSGEADFVASLGQAQSGLPRLRNVSLFTAWFGTDLRCNQCSIEPRVVSLTGLGVYHPYNWSVQGRGRDQVSAVSTSDGSPAYGSTPADRSVVEAIRKITDDGLAVTLTPFLLMDVPESNTRIDPYSQTIPQPPYPWRGRITCSPAPGVSGSPDMTATAATQVDTFMGPGVLPSHFATSADGYSVTYSGPNVWTYRRFILHYAALARAAGGVETFVIGSEMRGLTWVRSALGVYPFVTALVQLAQDVKTMLGNETKVVYAADWSEITPHQTGVSGEVFFHLDPLWASPAIDAIGIDNYWPLSDWRDGTSHADYLAGYRTIHDLDYLQANIAGGEGYDWYYANAQDRNDQVRTPITDGIGKPWVWRYKDIKNWWQNQHFNRPAGIEAAVATAWQPRSKPIWFMEIGCPAVDRGANQPNVFFDPKSSESALPYYSRGVADVRMMREYIGAMLSYYRPGEAGFVEGNNPASDVYSGLMIDLDRLYLYTWDARPYPAFPDRDDVWADAANYERGHWLNGRLERVAGDGAGGSGEGAEFLLPLQLRLTTGYVRVENLQGFTRHPTIELSQSIPAPLTVRSLRYEVIFGG